MAEPAPRGPSERRGGGPPERAPAHRQVWAPQQLRDSGAATRPRCLSGFLFTCSDKAQEKAGLRPPQGSEPSPGPGAKAHSRRTPSSCRGRGAGLPFWEMPDLSFQPRLPLPEPPLACLNAGPCPRGAQSRLCPGSQEEGRRSWGASPRGDWPHSSPAHGPACQGAGLPAPQRLRLGRREGRR